MVSMMTSSIWIFFASLALCDGNPSITGDEPLTRSFNIFFYLRLNKRVSKQSRHRWLETHRTHYDVTVMWANKRVHGGPVAVVARCYISPPRYGHNTGWLESMLHIRFLTHLSSVCLGWSIISLLSCMKYMGLCIISWRCFSPDDSDDICTLSYYHHQIGIMAHVDVNNAVCHMLTKSLCIRTVCLWPGIKWNTFWLKINPKG